MGVFKEIFERNPWQLMGFGITAGCQTWLNPIIVCVSLNLFSEVGIITPTLQDYFEDHVKWCMSSTEYSMWHIGSIQ